jgi:hypothetical protein
MHFYFVKEFFPATFKKQVNFRNWNSWAQLSPNRLGAL